MNTSSTSSGSSSLVSILVLAASVAIGGCAAETDSATAPTDSSAEDLSSAKDTVLIANAEKLFNGLLYQGGDANKFQITYDQLGSKLEAFVKDEAPDPKDEWAPRCYEAKVKNGKGVDTNIVLVMDGIDDEGETDTIYTTRGTSLASGGTYRSDLPAWATTTK